MADDLQEAFDNAMPITVPTEKPVRKANPFGSGRSLVSRVVTPAMQNVIRGVGEFAAPSILPTAGSIGLPAAATAIAGPANIPLIPIERAAGGVLGLYGNKVLGISDPTAADYALEAGLPLGAEVGSNLIRAVKPFVPMSKAAETMQPLAHTEALNTVKGLRSGLNARQAMQQATQQGVSVPLTKTATMLGEIEKDVVNATPEGQRVWIGILKKTGIADDVAKGTVTPSKMQNLLADVGRMEADAASPLKGNRLQADKLGKLFSALSDDLDQVPALEQARALFKREKVLDEINQEIASAFRLNAGQSTEKFSANKVVNVLQDKDGRLGKFFSQAFTPAEQKDTIEFFKFLNTIPGMSPPANVSRGFQKVGREALVGGSVGIAVGTQLGMNPATAGALGTVGGLVGGPAIDSVETMMQAWRMQGGKDLIKGLLKNSDGALTPQIMGTIGAFVAGKIATPPSQPSTVIQPPTELQRAFANQP